MFSKNKLYTLSYFRKRLFEENIRTRILYNKFNSNDKRYWMISIFDELNIICTCYKYNDIVEFEFHDGNQHIPCTRIIRTDSMKIIFEYLKRFQEKEKINASTFDN